MTEVAPLVSVILPVHNREDAVERAVRSALRQTVGDLEVVVIDDASTDQTASVVARIEDDRVRLVQMPENRGPAAARNMGMRKSTGTYVSFLDSDDEWLPGKVREQIASLEADADVGLVYGSYLISANGRVARHDIPRPEGNVFEAMMVGWSGPLPSTVTLRRELLDEAPFDEDLYGLEDYDLWLALSRRTSFRASERPVAIIDKSTGGRVTLAADRRLEGIDRLRKKWEPEMLARGRSQEWAERCDQLEVVTRLSGVRIGAGFQERARLAWEALASPIPRRTKLAGLLRLATGPAVAAWIQDLWFLMFGVDRGRLPSG